MTHPLNSSFPVGSLFAWCGPVCPICHNGFLGEHECRVEDLQRQIDGLQRKINELAARRPPQLRQCPCLRSNQTAVICMNVACPNATKVTC